MVEGGEGRGRWEERSDGLSASSAEAERFPCPKTAEAASTPVVNVCCYYLV